MHRAQIELIFFVLLSSIPNFLKPGIRAQAGFLHSNGTFAGGSVVFLDVSNDCNARRVSHIHGIRSNTQCGIFTDCVKVRQTVFCGALNRPLMRRCVADSGFFLPGRAFEQLRRRRRIRHGGRCEPEQGRAGSRRQSKFRRINRCRWRGGFPASRPRYHGDRRDSRGGHPAHGGYRAVRSAFGGLLLQCRKQGIEAVVVVVEPFPPHARPPISLRTPRQESQVFGAIIPAGAGIRLPGDGPSLVTGP